MFAEEMFERQLAGFSLAIGSLVMTAIFPVFSKIEKVKQCRINPMIFNIYFQCGVVLFCIITTIMVALFGPIAIHFSYYGLTSGVLLGIGGWFIWLSLTYVGIAHTSAIASGTASVTGFIEGIFIGNYPDHLILSLFALFLIVIGILGIGFNEALTSFIMQRLLCQTDEDHIVQIMSPNGGYNDLTYDQPQTLFRFASNPYTLAPDGDEEELIHAKKRETDAVSLQDMDSEETETSDEEPLLPSHMDRTETTPMKLRLTGIAFSFLGGICFGSMAFPEEFTSNSTTEAYFIPSFGVGVLLMIVVDGCVLNFMMNVEQEWHFGKCFTPALASGCIWSIGFLCILYAELLISYSMAIPIRECSICVA
eukprot:406422_1